MAPRHKYALNITLRNGRTHDVIYATQSAGIDEYDRLVDDVEERKNAFVRVTDNESVLALRIEDIVSVAYGLLNEPPTN